MIATGALDFRLIDRSGLPSALALAELWPSGMRHSLELSELGLDAEELELQARAEREAQEAELKRRRTVTIGDIEIDGGAVGRRFESFRAHEKNQWLRKTFAGSFAPERVTNMSPWHLRACPRSR